MLVEPEAQGPRICLSLAESNLTSLQRKIDKYLGRVHLIETRLDYLESVELPHIPETSLTQFVATCRSKDQGGHFEGSEEARLEVLHQAFDSNYHWVDLEYNVPLPKWASPLRLLRSIHLFDEVPGDWNGLANQLREEGAALVKIAAQIGTSGELIQLLQAMEQPQTGPRIFIGMGEIGRVSRLLGAFMGNVWTYVAEEKSIAPGQFTLQEALQLYRLPEWQEVPRYFGVLGNPIGHSKSPLIHNSLFRYHGVDALYLPIQLDKIDPWLGYLRETGLNFGGFSVTLPFKESLGQILSNPPDEPVNTLVKNDTGWVGHNTDTDGFLQPLKKRSSLRGKRVLLLGSGGAANTACKALTEAGAMVIIFGRNWDRIEELSKRHGATGLLMMSGGDPPPEADICVNATPVGQAPDVDSCLLKPEDMHFDLVYDLVYNPRETLLIKQAKELGQATISGIEMFVEQAALQFHIWTGIDPDRALLQTILTGASPGEHRSDVA